MTQPSATMPRRATWNEHTVMAALGALDDATHQHLRLRGLTDPNTTATAASDNVRQRTNLSAFHSEAMPQMSLTDYAMRLIVHSQATCDDIACALALISRYVVKSIDEQKHHATATQPTDLSLDFLLSPPLDPLKMHRLLFAAFVVALKSCNDFVPVGLKFLPAIGGVLPWEQHRLELELLLALQFEALPKRQEVTATIERLASLRHPPTADCYDLSTVCKVLCACACRYDAVDLLQPVARHTYTGPAATRARSSAAVPVTSSAEPTIKHGNVLRCETKHKQVGQQTISPPLTSPADHYVDVVDSLSPPEVFACST